MTRIKVRGDEKLEVVEVGAYYLFGSPDIGDDTQKRVARERVHLHWHECYPDALSIVGELAKDSRALDHLRITSLRKCIRNRGKNVFFLVFANNA